MYTEAELLQKIAEARQHGTAADSRVLQACQRLADWYVSVGRLEEARSRWSKLIQELDTLPQARLCDRAVAHVRLAEVLHGLGQLQAEQTELWTAVEILRLEQPTPRLDLAYILNQLAEVTYELGRYETSLTASQQAMACLTDVVASTHHEMIRTRNNLAAAHSVRGELELAERLLRQNLKVLASQYGEQDAGLIVPLQNLAEIRRAAGDQSDAAALLAKADALSSRRLGASHAVTLHGLLLQADLLAFQGDFSSAERMLRRVLETQRQTTPDDRRVLARTLLELGTVLCQRNRYRDAEPLLDEALRYNEQLHGELHPKTSAVCVQLSEVYLGLGRLANAERAIQRALGIQQLALHPQSTAYAAALRQSAIVAMARKDWATAQSAIDEAISHLARQTALRSELKFDVHLTAADFALQQGCIEPAQQHLNHAESLRKQPCISLIARINYRRLVAQLALLRQEYDEAHVACQRAFRLLEHLPTHPPALVARIATVAAETALFRKDYTTCLALCDQEQAFRDALGQSDALDMTYVLIRQAQAHLGQSAYSEAAIPLQRALAIAERSYQSPPGLVHQILEQLAQLYLKQRDYNAFRPWMQRVLTSMESTDTQPQDSSCEDWVTVLRDAGENTVADELTDQLITLRNRQSHVLGDLL